MVRLYLARVTDELPTLPLSEYRENRLAALRDPLAKRQSLCVEALLLRALAEEGKTLPLPLRYTVSPLGKPELADADLHISLSHAGEFVLCALADAPVGADIETVRPVKMRVGERFFSPDELAQITDDASFLRVWVMKEARVKALGQGILSDMRSFSVFDEPEKYFYRFSDGVHLAAYSPSGESFEAITLL